MNASVFSTANIKHEEELQRDIKDKAKKKEYNDRYQQKKKQAIEILDEVKGVLGLSEVNGRIIEEKIREKERTITELEKENKRIHEIYRIQIDKMREEIQRNGIEREQQKVVREVEDQLGRMNDRIGRMESMDRIIKDLEGKAERYIGAYYFIKELEKEEPNTVNNMLIILKKKRERAPLEPESLDRIVAASNIRQNGNLSPEPIMRRRF